MWSDPRRAALAAVEHVWAAGAWAAGRAVPAPRRWRPGGRVLVVAAHPDDETIGAGGTICLHLDAGDPLTVAVVTDGGASRAGGLDSAEMARRRRGEAEAAAATLGAAPPLWLGLPENRWMQAEAAAALRPLVEAADV